MSQKIILPFGKGTDGDLVISADTTEAPIDATCTGTIGTRTLSATNGSFAAGQVILIHQTQGTGAGQWELNVIDSYVAGTITTKIPLTYGYVGGAQVRTLPQYQSMTVQAGKTYTAKAWNGSTGGILAFLCRGKTTIAGVISATSKGFRGGAGTSLSSGLQTGWQGESEVGAGSRATSPNGMAGGGSSYSSGNGKNGGSAGHVNAGQIGVNDSSGTAGAAGGVGGDSTSLSTWLFGAGGGGGGTKDNTVFGQNGGNGGGIVGIWSRILTITGNIYANGSPGANGGGNNSTGGGAGSGGCIGLWTKVLTWGSSLVTALGDISGLSMSGNSGTTSVSSPGRIAVNACTINTGNSDPSYTNNGYQSFCGRLKTL